jgi:molecular chaperone GrpE
MNEEEIKAEEQENVHGPEEGISEGHAPDVGTPETHAAPPAGGSDLEKARLEATEWRDKYFRLYAEFDNFRKRSAKERLDLLGSASADLIRELLPVLDDFDRGARANESATEVGPVKEGFNLIHQKLYRRLEQKGLKPVDAAGKAFDTDYHEAITQVPAGEDMKGKVVEEVEKGYLLNDKIIRFSKVVIGQ